jgi:hypothetical protein
LAGLGSAGVRISSENSLNGDCCIGVNSQIIGAQSQDLNIGLRLILATRAIGVSAANELCHSAGGWGLADNTVSNVTDMRAIAAIDSAQYAIRLAKIALWIAAFGVIVGVLAFLRT